MRRLHLIIGILGVIAFLLTGQYMDRVHDHLVGMADGPRMLFRSAHIYLLFAALLNLALGAYLELAPRGLERWAQMAASTGVIALPAMFLTAFFTEPWLADFARPWSRPAIDIAVASVLLHVVVATARRVQGRRAATALPLDAV